MNLMSLSVNHRIATVEVREKLSVPENALGDWSEKYTSMFPNWELMLLSTCNRTEIYTAHCQDRANPEFLQEFIATQSGISLEVVAPVTELRTGTDAATHLFRVATGLDSMVPGETQILGQIKRAYENAQGLGTLGKTLHLTIQQAITAAKKIRQQTGVDSGRISIGSVAVDFIKQIFSQFEDKTVVVIGAGEMIKLTLKHLLPLTPKELVISNRTLENAQSLAHHVSNIQNYQNIRVRSLDELASCLVDADIVLTCTGSVDPILTHSLLKPLMKKRRQRPLCMIDLAVPRDIAEDISKLKNTYLYNIDDLQKVIEATLNDRKDVFLTCEQLISQAVAQCAYQIQHQEIGVLVKKLRAHFHELAELEKDRTAKKLISDIKDSEMSHSQDIGQLELHINERLEEYSHRLINKILHAPMAQLKGKEPPAKDELPFFAHALEHLFLPNDMISGRKSNEDNS